MSFNPYQPPRAEILDASLGGPSMAPSENRPYFVTSITKLVTLMILSYGLYMIYWSYKHWATYRDAFKASVWPVPRAIFPVFFIHRLFDGFQNTANSEGIETEKDLDTWATILVLVMIISSVSSQFNGGNAVFLVGMVSLGLMILCLVPAQKVANMVCGDPLGASNSRFGLANFCFILLGLVYWGLILFAIVTRLKQPT